MPFGAALSESRSADPHALPDEIIDPVSLRAMAEHDGAKITEIDASHVAMISHPDVFVEVIGQALREVGELQPA